MLLNLQIQGIVFGAIIGVPNLCLLKTDAVQMPLGFTVKAVSQFLGILEGPAIAFNHAFFTLDIVRDTAMARRKGNDDLYCVARAEAFFCDAV